ncbi:hypothetical protein [Pantanalinema sp. GBBB05]|uniref:hypothetical protein n=1 Tax=Pantanalinema sp. GBBB05 TaxID=2604139 RepID=UPI001D976BBD|nr:hypothetical protein [Pantanalinema sp. GBBB05]
MIQVAVKDSKAKLLEAFQQLLVERRNIESKVATKADEARQLEDQQILVTVSQYTADSIVRGLADLRLECSQVINELSTKLSTENSKLDELQRAIAVETQYLDTLRKVRIVADALHILTQEHQEKLDALQHQAESDREQLEKEITDTQKSWQQEQEEFEAIQLEHQSLLQQERTRQAADYHYDTERARKLAIDEYEAKQRQVERQLAEAEQTKAKEWAERERILASQQTLLAEYQQRVAALPTEQEEAVKKAREEGIRDVHQDAKVKADLLEKEWESTKQGYELQIQALEAKVHQQTAQITEISTQLQTVMHQAQELAMRAFETSTHRSAA